MGAEPSKVVKPSSGGTEFASKDFEVRCPSGLQYAPITSQYIAIIGQQFGDEGKGRTIPDLKKVLCQVGGVDNPIAMVVKVNGGANSGHTVDGLKHNLVPAGVTDDSIDVLALGRSVVADPFKLHREILSLEAYFRERGETHQVSGRMVLDPRCMFSDLTDRIRDLAKEVLRVARGETPRGTTGMGITPAFANETQQEQIWYEVFKDGISPNLAEQARNKFCHQMRNRIALCQMEVSSWFRSFDGVALATELDLGNKVRVQPEVIDGVLVPRTWDLILDKIAERDLRVHKKEIDSGVLHSSDIDVRKYRASGEVGLDTEALIQDYWYMGCKLAAILRIEDLSDFCDQFVSAGRYVIGEFGQSYWLDGKGGYAPNVSASRTRAGELRVSLDIPDGQPVHVIGVVKAYKTAVGTHLFPTELARDGALYAQLAPLEFGTTTGRQRMVGYFDAVEVGHAMRRGGGHDLVINKLDALTATKEGIGSLRICVAYRTADGTLLRKMPTSDLRRALLTPVYVEFPNWSEDISDIRDFRHLPINAQRYVAGLYRAISDNIAFDARSSQPLPNLRFIGVGPGPTQIIAEGIPSPERLSQIASDEALVVWPV